MCGVICGGMKRYKKASLCMFVCVCVCRSTLAVDRAANFPNCHGDNVIRKTWDFLGIDKAMTSSRNRDLRYFDVLGNTAVSGIYH